MHEFEQTEDVIIERLQTLKSSGLKALEAYSGQLDVEALDEIIVLFPFIYVAAQGLQVDPVNRYDDYRLDVTLIVGDRNLRSNAAPARGDSGSPGVYALLEAARSRLHRFKALSGWTPLALSSESPLVYAPKSRICIYTAVYSAKTVK
jgi:phage gp37-like protein